MPTFANRTIRLALLGEGNTGKTTLLRQWTGYARNIRCRNENISFERQIAGNVWLIVVDTFFDLSSYWKLRKRYDAVIVICNGDRPNQKNLANSWWKILQSEYALTAIIANNYGRIEYRNILFTRETPLRFHFSVVRNIRACEMCLESVLRRIEIRER